MNLIIKHHIKALWGTLIIAATACNNVVTDNSSLCDGDLLFQQCETSSFSEAIIDATASDDGPSFSHVGIFTVINGDSLVIEAVPNGGVTLTPLGVFLSSCPAVKAMRVPHDVSIVDALARAKSYLGREYDWEFDADNDKMYCSELVQASYLWPDGSPLFESVSMNFLDAEGAMPQFWIDLFDSLQKPIPQGMPGTNPNSIYASPALTPINY